MRGRRFGGVGATGDEKRFGRFDFERLVRSGRRRRRGGFDRSTAERVAATRRFEERRKEREEKNEREPERAPTENEERERGATDEEKE